MRKNLDRKQTSNHDSDQSLLEMLSSTVACLKQKHMDLEALGCLEQSLWLKRRMFGVDNSVVHKALNEVMLSYNSVAMQYLAQGQFDQCLAMLRKAEAITAPGNFKRCQALQILTFNNIGCCYRKLGKLKSALKYLKEAAQIGSGTAHVKNLSITHLNLCAIQSQLGRHDLALEHAQAAIFHTQEELVSLEDGATNERDEDDGCCGDDREQVDALDPKTREEKIISLAVAYHNLAVELEFNGRGEASLQWYKKALQLVWKYRETNEALCESFKKIFLDAKKKQQSAHVRQNGIPASASSANSSGNGRRPITRPRSAHASSRYANEADRGDVSYSSTVASQCYKATKPSTAGLRYGSPRTAAGIRGAKPQRPASATTRQRPMSAKLSTQANYRASSNGSRDSAEDTVELHWKRLEREHDLNNLAPRKLEHKNRRPQSAGSANTAARRRNQVTNENQRRQKLEGHLYFAAKDDDIIGNDEDYGVIDDDGDCDDGFDNYPGAPPSAYSSNQLERVHNNENGRASCISGHRSRASGGPRHRRALDDSRSHASLETSGDSESIAASSRGPEQDSPIASLTGYSGDDDTDPDLPAQRVGHMEYLRRMKKLAESIKDDLNGIGTHQPTVKPAQLAANHARSPDRIKVESSRLNNESGSRVSTPQSATSKLRDRIEQARRDSMDTLPESETGSGNSNQVQHAMSTPPKQSTVKDNGVDIWEDFHVFGSETEARDAELRKFYVAAGCRLQAFIRGHHCRTEVNQLKQLENDSATLIQQQARQYLEALQKNRRLEEVRLQLELQKEEVEDMAACLIQRLCRRLLSRRNTSMTRGDGEDTDDKPASQRQPHSIADVVLGAAVNKSIGSVQTLMNQEEQYPRLNPAATVPRINLNYPQNPEEPRRSFTLSSIPLSNRGEGEMPIKTQHDSTSRSDVYEDEEKRKMSPSHSANPTPRIGSSTENDKSLSSLTADRECQHEAATRIQALIKSFLVRQRIAQNDAGDLCRSYIERKHFFIALDNAVGKMTHYLVLVAWLTHVRLLGVFVAGAGTRVSRRTQHRQNPGAGARLPEPFAVRMHEGRNLFSCEHNSKVFSVASIQYAARS
ncbi:unnamed protein product [Phytophthora fragariaefolia]|uniref:Unnamed protein product n=1 Tax=Phytophthora fragariaefolia TaxID=1490495 RepID=A0A9W7DF53_9STRA|nr:unnamed protein product [Phytophthora fragariaefolia]